jgi:hypothetical protein
VEYATDMESLNRLTTERTNIIGSGGSVGMRLPCPFCAQPDVREYALLSMKEQCSKPAVCPHCERGYKLIFTRASTGVRFEMVQTEGPDQPEWLRPQMRRV